MRDSIVNSKLGNKIQYKQVILNKPNFNPATAQLTTIDLGLDLTVYKVLALSAHSDWSWAALAVSRLAEITTGAVQVINVPVNVAATTCNFIIEVLYCKITDLPT